MEYWEGRRGEFQASVEASVLSEADASVMSTEDFTFLLLDSANGCMSKTSSQLRRLPVPWWTKECGDATRASKRTFRKFGRSGTTESFIAFKKARAFARCVLETKAVSWRTYVSSLNRFTPMTQAWARMKRIE